MSKVEHVALSGLVRLALAQLDRLVDIQLGELVSQARITDGKPVTEGWLLQNREWMRSVTEPDDEPPEA